MWNIMYFSALEEVNVKGAAKITIFVLVYIMRMRICELETRNGMPILKTHHFSLHEAQT